MLPAPSRQVPLGARFDKHIVPEQRFNIDMALEAAQGALAEANYTFETRDVLVGAGRRWNGGMGAVHSGVLAALAARSRWHCVCSSPALSPCPPPFPGPQRDEAGQPVLDEQGRPQPLRVPAYIGLVIDLTRSSRYYDPQNWLQRGVKYVKVRGSRCLCRRLGGAGRSGGAEVWAAGWGFPWQWVAGWHLLCSILLLEACPPLPHMLPAAICCRPWPRRSRAAGGARFRSQRR